MALKGGDLYFLLEQASIAAVTAGKYIASQVELQCNKGRLGTRHANIRLKNTSQSLAAQVLTEVDLKSQSLILEILSKSCKQYDIAVLSEEIVDDKSRLGKNYFWCIDPMDGTLAFVESKEGFSVSIALVSREGLPVVGVVYEPLTEKLFTAIDGQGAWLNNKALSEPFDSLTASKKLLTISTDTSFVEREDFVDLLGELKLLAHSLDYLDVEMVYDGGAVMNACWLLERAPGCYFKIPKQQKGGGHFWDFAATSLIFKETGACVSDAFGKPLVFSHTESTYMNLYGAVYATDHKIQAELQKFIHLLNR